MIGTNFLPRCTSLLYLPRFLDKLKSPILFQAGPNYFKVKKVKSINSINSNVIFYVNMINTLRV